MNEGYGRLTLSLMAGVLTAAFILISGSKGGASFVYMDKGLSQKHKALEKDCEACHEPWAGVADSRCLKCHKEGAHKDVAASPGKKIPAHMVAGAEGKNPPCHHCHGEHKGETFGATLVKDKVCFECHSAMIHKPGGPEPSRPPIKSGVLLTHNAFFMAGEYSHNKCMGCHTGPKAKPISNTGNHLVDLMYHHMTQVGASCQDCHDKVEVVMFDAKGGGIGSGKCSSCHEEKRISGVCKTCHRFHRLKAA